MKHMLPKLITALEPFKGDAQKFDVPPFTSEVPKEENDIISHSWFWPRVGKFFKANDVVVGETGTSSFGLIDVPFPHGATFVSQILWGSIGWTVGSTLGAALAARDRNLGGRTILFIGDGSMYVAVSLADCGLAESIFHSQLTAQEITPMIRLKLNPIMSVFPLMTKKSVTDFALQFPAQQQGLHNRALPSRQDAQV
jgi:pyruvate decarboxylase